MDDGWNEAQGNLAVRAALRGDYSRIEARARAGMRLTPDELAALDRRDRGVAVQRGPKDPQTDAEAVVTCRWLHEVAGERLVASYAFYGEMTGRTGDAVKATVRRAARGSGLGPNIADHAFNRHRQTGDVPPLLRYRCAQWRCIYCRQVRCECDPGIRPKWTDCVGGITVRLLIQFARG